MNDNLFTQVRQRIASLDESAKNLDSLSDRESQIVLMAAVGMSDREIADLLQISSGTLGTYWSRIRQKSGFRKRTEALAAFWRRHGTLDVESIEDGVELGRGQIGRLMSPILRDATIPIALWSEKGDLVEANAEFRTLMDIKSDQESEKLVRGKVLRNVGDSDEGDLRQRELIRSDGSMVEVYESRFPIDEGDFSVSFFFRR
jgi:DNA-binding CsgD family transcriptional regulator